MEDMIASLVIVSAAMFTILDHRIIMLFHKNVRTNIHVLVAV